MTNKVSITFDSEELEHLEVLARDRSEGKRAHGVTNKRIDQKRSDYDIDLLGVQAEYFFSRLFNVDMHHLVNSLHGDAGQDFTISGLKFGINGIFSGASYLIVPAHQHGKYESDVIVLFQQSLSKKRMTCLGWTTGEYFEQNCVWRSFGYGDQPALHHRHLLPIDDLIDMVKHDANS